MPTYSPTAAEAEYLGSLFTTATTPSDAAPQPPEIISADKPQPKPKPDPEPLTLEEKDNLKRQLRRITRGYEIYRLQHGDEAYTFAQYAAIFYHVPRDVAQAFWTTGDL